MQATMCQPHRSAYLHRILKLVLTIFHLVNVLGFEPIYRAELIP